MKKYEYKVMTFVLALACLLSLVGCDTKSQTMNNEQTETGTTEENLTGETSASDSIPFCGTWYVWDYQAAKVSALSADAVDELSQSVIVYAEDSVTLNEETFDISGYNYETEEYSYDRILEDYGVNLGEWWNEIDHVSSVSITAEDDFFGKHFFIASDDVIWIYHEGVFFLARQESLPQ